MSNTYFLSPTLMVQGNLFILSFLLHLFSNDAQKIVCYASCNAIQSLQCFGNAWAQNTCENF